MRSSSGRNCAWWKAQRRASSFNREKLFSGVRKACEKRPVKMEDIEQLMNNIANKLEEEGCREIPSTVIGAKLMLGLEALDHVAYVRYARRYRQFEDVGAFINEIQSLGKRRQHEKDQAELFRPPASSPPPARGSRV